MNKYLPFAALGLIVLGTTWIQGVWSERWQEFPELELFAKQLDNVPKAVGSWTGTDLPAEDKKVLEMAGAVGSLSRVYKKGKDTVNIFIVCGRLQDVFYHTPDRCYPAAGFEMGGEKERQSFEVPGGTADFFTTTFMKSDPGGTQNVRVYWTWNASGVWEAPDNEKVGFAGSRAIYKLYVVSPVVSGNERIGERDATVEFIRQFVPELQKALAPATAGAGPQTTAQVETEKTAA
jgi:hypothetical protein